MPLSVAAANALSDIYAMGGEPLTAMNIATFPKCWDMDLFGEILRAGGKGEGSGCFADWRTYGG